MLLFSLVSFVTTILKNIMPEISILLYYPLILPFQEKSAEIYFFIFFFAKQQTEEFLDNLKCRIKRKIDAKTKRNLFELLSVKIDYNFFPVLLGFPRLTHCEYIDRRLCIAVYGNAETLFSSNFQHSKQCFA